MNETLSLLFVTAALAVGGLGLFMYKSSDDENVKEGSDYKEDELFGNQSFWGSNNDEEEEFEEDYVEPKVTKSRSSGKTKRNKKTGGTKRRY
jgi:hypothetical protein